MLAALGADIVKRHVVVICKRLEVVVVTDDHADVRAEVVVGPGLEQCLEAVALFGDENGDLLVLAVGGEPRGV